VSADQNTGDYTVFVHEQAICETRDVGGGTRIWAFAHVMDGAIIGQDCNLCDHVFVEGHTRIGDRVTVKNNVLIWEGVTIEDDVFVGPNVIFTNDRYPRSGRMPEVTDKYAKKENWLTPTLVRRGASFGAGAVIICGVTIGRFAGVGAGAIVTRDVLDHQLVVGQPARPVGWICICGRPLDDSLRCPQCRRHFISQASGLVSAD
jgi:acetyltransferase-like isoleucine patch superfamily enzyme